MQTVYIGLNIKNYHESKTLGHSLCPAINSAIGAVMAFTSVASDIIIDNHPSAWMLDPIVGYVFGIFFGLYGVWLVAHYRIQSSES